MTTMKLMIYELPRLPTGPNEEDVPPDERTLRHWLTFDDGRIFFQDETLTLAHRYGDPSWVSTRGEWVQLPTPPVTPRPVALIETADGEPMVMLDNGMAYVLQIRPPDVLPHWNEVMEPVPTTGEDLRGWRKLES